MQKGKKETVTFDKSKKKPTGSRDGKEGKSEKSSKTPANDEEQPGTPKS